MDAQFALANVTDYSRINYIIIYLMDQIYTLYYLMTKNNVVVRYMIKYNYIDSWDQ